jgi:hypothetical protein
MNSADVFYAVIKHFTSLEGGLAQPTGAEGKRAVIATAISLGLVPSNTDPASSSYSTFLGAFEKRGLMRREAGKVITTETPYAFGQPIKDTTFPQLVTALRHKCPLSGVERDIVDRFKRTRDLMPVVSRQDYLRRYAEFQPVVQGREVAIYAGRELHVTHLVGQSLLAASDKDLRFGDAIVATPDVNAAMSHFGVSYFGDVSVIFIPGQGLALRVKNGSVQFSVPDATPLVMFPKTDFHVFDIDGQPHPLHHLLRNSTEVQQMLIKYKPQLVDVVNA